MLLYSPWTVSQIWKRQYRNSHKYKEEGVHDAGPGMLILYLLKLSFF